MDAIYIDSATIDNLLDNDKYRDKLSAGSNSQPAASGPVTPLAGPEKLRDKLDFLEFLAAEIRENPAHHSDDTFGIDGPSMDLNMQFLNDLAAAVWLANTDRFADMWQVLDLFVEDMQVLPYGTATCEFPHVRVEVTGRR